MAFWIAFDKPTDDLHTHPHDPDDLDRCLRLRLCENVNVFPWKSSSIDN